MTPSQIAKEAARHLYPDGSNCERLILAAAAKIVKESGAVGLLDVAKCPQCNGQGWYEDVAADVHTGEAEQIQQQCQWCDEKNTALTALRALTETGEGKP